MQTAIRSRASAAIALSIAAHVVVVGALVLSPSPPRPPPFEPSGPPVPIIPLLLLPRTPPPAPGAAVRSSAIRLHRRPPRNAPDNLPVAPLIAPVVEQAPPAPPPPSGPPAAAPGPPSGGPQLRAILRGVVGCANPEAAGLTPEERERCDQKLAADARSAPYLGQGLSRDKQAQFDGAARRQEACRQWRDSAVPDGLKGNGLGVSPPAGTC